MSEPHRRLRRRVAILESGGRHFTFFETSLETRDLQLYGDEKEVKRRQDKSQEGHERYKDDSLKSGSGKKVKSRKQAVAIALSEARKSGAKIPKKKKS